MNSYELFQKPKETLRNLKIAKSVISNQISYIPNSFVAIKEQSRFLIALIDFSIRDYEDFFKQKYKKQGDQLSLFN